MSMELIREVMGNKGGCPREVLTLRASKDRRWTGKEQKLAPVITRVSMWEKRSRVKMAMWVAPPPIPPSPPFST